MEDFLASADIGEGRSLHVATLSRDTIVESGAEHLGFSGYFLFEVSEIPASKGIHVLAKANSFDAAMRLIDLWQIVRPA